MCLALSGNRGQFPEVGFHTCILVYADSAAVFAPLISIHCCCIRTMHKYTLMLLRHLVHTLMLLGLSPCINADGAVTFASTYIAYADDAVAFGPRRVYADSAAVLASQIIIC